MQYGGSVTGKVRNATMLLPPPFININGGKDGKKKRSPPSR